MGPRGCPRAVGPRPKPQDAAGKPRFLGSAFIIGVCGSLRVVGAAPSPPTLSKFCPRPQAAGHSGQALHVCSRAFAFGQEERARVAVSFRARRRGVSRGCTGARAGFSFVVAPSRGAFLCLGLSVSERQAAADGIVGYRGAVGGRRSGECRWLRKDGDLRVVASVGLWLGGCSCKCLPHPLSRRFGRSWVAGFGHCGFVPVWASWWPQRLQVSAAWWP